MISSYRHTGIVVKNLKKSEIFYCKLLNLKKVSKIIEGGSYLNKLIGGKNFKIRVLKVKSKDNVIIEIIQFINLKMNKQNKPTTMNNLGTMHMCFTVKNIMSLYKKLKKNKIFFFSPPLKSPYDPVITCFCYDPDFNLVQFVQGPQVKSK